jgi:hypothetical protein
VKLSTKLLCYWGRTNRRMDAMLHYDRKRQADQLRRDLMEFVHENHRKWLIANHAASLEMSDLYVLMSDRYAVGSEPV